MERRYDVFVCAICKADIVYGTMCSYGCVNDDIDPKVRPGGTVIVETREIRTVEQKPYTTSGTF